MTPDGDAGGRARTHPLDEGVSAGQNCLYVLANGQRLASGDFEGGKAGAVRVLGRLGFTVQERRPAS
jgi:hypothetical protein